jgi:hypothetical protein
MPGMAKPPMPGDEPAVQTEQPQAEPVKTLAQCYQEIFGDIFARYQAGVQLASS